MDTKIGKGSFMPVFPNHMQQVGKCFILNHEVSAAVTGLKVKFRYSIVLPSDVEGVRLISLIGTGVRRRGS